MNIEKISTKTEEIQELLSVIEQDIKVNQDNLAKFVEIIILEDSEEGLWVTGIPEQVEIIIQGQGFVEDGQEVITNRI